jgi:nitrite reductase/ring-hydroxylating ferredoxin subunit/uncharacterized membrane protein
MGLLVGERVERVESLDPVGDRLSGVVRRVLRPQWLRDVLHGVPLGHALHPVLVQLPVGAWMSAAVLDALPGQKRAATTLIAVGVASAVPAALTGANDWASLGPEQRRVGLVHAAANSVALALFGGSLVARARGRYGAGKALSYTALAIAGGSAYLGGHLSYAQGAGMNQAAPALRLIPEGWHDLGATGEFTDGATAVRHVGEVPVLVYRDGDRFSVLLERCAHQSGPLGEGKVEGGCVVCPWHGSTFRLTDGSVKHGPAASNQPTLRVRVTGDRVTAGLP